MSMQILGQALLSGCVIANASLSTESRPRTDIPTDRTLRFFERQSFVDAGVGLRALRRAPLDDGARQAILAALPSNGELAPSSTKAEKLALMKDGLVYHDRHHVFQTKVNDVRQAVVVGLHAPSAARPWPCQLTVMGVLRPFAELAWQHSPTFRKQCLKLAAGGAALVVEPVARPDMWRALTRIGRLPDGTTMARARVRPSAHSVELIAHELEHVLEYLEGFQFLMESRRRHSRVSLIGGAYETERAIDAGRRVAQEVRNAILADAPSRGERAIGAGLALP